MVPVVKSGFESPRPPQIFGPLAQLVEQETLNLLVVGSIPTRPTNFLGDRTFGRPRPDEGRTCHFRVNRKKYPRLYAPFCVGGTVEVAIASLDEVGIRLGAQGGSAVGLLILGSQSIAVTGNHLASGYGPGSIGISIDSYMGELLEPNVGNSLTDNTNGSFVTAIEDRP